MMKRLTSVVCIAFLLVSFILMSLPAEAASGPSLRTTLTDNIIQRGSKKTFDVWARNSAGQKIKAIVKFNGQKIEPTWDDTEKASYTLTFTKEGENVVTVLASSDGGKRKELTYHITYKKANPGEPIGTAVWSVEMFTLGCGYLVYPVETTIYEGENAAEQLVRLLHDHGYVSYYGGSVKQSFYMAYVASGTVRGEQFNGYKKSGVPDNPCQLVIHPSIPDFLDAHLEETMSFYDPNDYANNWEGYLGEFVISNGSGWMYSVNNVFPNVGFADSYPSDGDVIRVQFTLGYGADIGGFSSMGSDIPGVDNQPSSGYFNAANKDQLTKSICNALSSGLLNYSKLHAAYDQALTVVSTLNSTQTAVNNATAALNKALKDAENGADTPEPPQPTKPSVPEPPQPTKPSTPKPPQPTKPSIPEPPRPTNPSNPKPPQPTKPSVPVPPQPTRPTDTKPVGPNPTDPEQPIPEPTVSQPVLPDPTESQPGVLPEVPETSKPDPTQTTPVTPGPSDHPDGTVPTHTEGTTENPAENTEKDHTAVLIVLSILCVLLLAVIVAGVYSLRKKGKSSGKE